MGTTVDRAGCRRELADVLRGALCAKAFGALGVGTAPGRTGLGPPGTERGSFARLLSCSNVVKYPTAPGWRRVGNLRGGSRDYVM